MRKRLTTKSLENAKSIAGKRRVELRDDLVIGLSCRVYDTGKKVFYLNKRLDGSQRRIKIGEFPYVSLEQARIKARDLLTQIELGEFEKGDDAPKAPTLAIVVEDFIRLYAKPRNRDWKRTAALLRKFEPLYSKPIDEIKRPMIVAILDELIAGGMGTGVNRALSSISKLFNWAADRGIIEHNPIAGMKKPVPERSRDRILSDKELRAVWRSSAAEGYPFGAFTQVLIATGQRRSEVAEMRWSEIDFEKGIWTLPAERAKNKSLHVIPLSPVVTDLLQSVPRFLRSDYVFTTTGTSPISGIGKYKERLTSASKTDTIPWTIHDIRRTVATEMARLGIAPHIIEAVLNHKTGVISGVASIYNRYGYAEEKREALERWGDELTRTVDQHRHPNTLRIHFA